MSAHVVSAVSVQVKHLSVGLVLYICGFSAKRRVIAADTVLRLAVCQFLVKVVLKYRFCFFVLAFYLHLHSDLGAAHGELFVRKVQYRHVLGIKEHRFYISVTACVIERVAAVSCVFLCRTCVINDDQVAVLVCGKGVVSRSTELIVKVSTCKHWIGHFCPVVNICQICIRVCSHQAYAVFRAGCRRRECKIYCAVFYKGCRPFIYRNIHALPTVLRCSEHGRIAGQFPRLLRVNGCDEYLAQVLLCLVRP